jgi:hypothetical protein
MINRGGANVAFRDLQRLSFRVNRIMRQSPISNPRRSSRRKSAKPLPIELGLKSDKRTAMPCRILVRG